MSVPIENYQFDDVQKLYQTLISSSLPRKIVDGWRNQLNYLKDDDYKYYQIIDDSNPQVFTGRVAGSQRLAKFREKPITVDVTKIAETLPLTQAELEIISGSRIPVNTQVLRIIRKIGAAETRLFLAGDPSNSAAKPITDTTNASTAWSGTAFNVTTHALALSTLGQGLGQLYDTYEDLLQTYALFLVVSPDVWKLIGGENANTDRTTMAALTMKLKEWGLNTQMPTHVFSSKYLFGAAGALDYDNEDVVLGASGTRAAALLAYDINSIEAVNSNLFQQIVSTGRGIEIDIAESCLFTFTNNDAAIYEAGVTVA